jgi:hypothetical protein
MSSDIGMMLTLSKRYVGPRQFRPYAPLNVGEFRGAGAVAFRTMQASHRVMDATDRARPVVRKAILQWNALAGAQGPHALRDVFRHRARIGAACAALGATEAVGVWHYCRCCQCLT